MRRVFWIWLAFGLASLTLVGCGVPWPGASADDATIVFGTTLPITGPKAEEGRYTRDGYQFYVDAINARGGLAIGGKTYTVRLHYYDDGSDPAKIGPLYQRLVERDRVDFLLGPYSSQLTEPAVPIAEESRVPMVAAHGSAESLYSATNRYVFSIISPARNYLRGIIALVLAKDPSVRTVALLGADEPFSREVLDGAAEYAQEKHLAIVSQTLYPLNTGDVRDLLAHVRRANPDVLLVAGHLQDAILIVKQSKEQGLAPRAIGFTSGPSTPEFRANLQHDADYIFGATQWTSALTYSGIGLWATPHAYAAAFHAAHADYTQIPYQTAESTAALIVFQHAIEQAGSVDHEAVRAALASLDVMTFYGRVKFDERGVNIYKPMAVEQLQPDGKTYTVFPSDVAEKAALYPMPPWSQR
jgi:branched-chain amino acid transport system substrate-binding protein